MLFGINAMSGYGVFFMTSGTALRALFHSINSVA